MHCCVVTDIIIDDLVGMCINKSDISVIFVIKYGRIMYVGFLIR